MKKINIQKSLSLVAQKMYACFVVLMIVFVSFAPIASLAQTSTQTQWATQTDFNAGVNSNTSNATLPGDVVLTQNATLPDYTETSQADFNLGNINPNSNAYDTTATIAPGSVELGNYDVMYNYSSTSRPELGVDTAYGIHEVITDTQGLIYVAQDGGGVRVINMHNTIDQSDDTFVTTYTTTSTPAISNNGVLSLLLDETNHLLYIGGYGGVDVINTQGTLSPSDDILVWHATTARVNSLFIDYASPTGTLYASQFVFDMQGTLSDPSDDVLITDYRDVGQWLGTLTGGAIGDHNQVWIDASTGYLYVAETYGVDVVDTKNTLDSWDDTLVFRYHTTSTPPITGDPQKILYDADSGLLYVAGSGFSIVDTKKTPTPTDDTSVADAYGSAGLNHLIGNQVVFDFTIDSRTDFLYLNTYGGGVYVIDTQGTVDVLDDVLRSNYSYNDQGYHPIATPMNTFYGVSAFFDTAKHILYLGTGGVTDGLYAVGSQDYNPTGSFVSQSLPLATTPSGFISWDQTVTIDQTTTLSYRSGDGVSTWGAWSTACTTSPCSIDQGSLSGHSHIQYKLNLTTNDPIRTPRVNSVTLSSGYNTQGTYTSQNTLFATGSSMLSFQVADTLPTNTAITYEYSIDGGVTWNLMSHNYTFPSNFTATQFMWRANFSTTDTLVSPSIQGVTLTSDAPPIVIVPVPPSTPTPLPDPVVEPSVEVAATDTTTDVSISRSTSKILLEGNELQTGNDINYVSVPTPRLEGKNTDVKNGEVYLYQLRPEGGKEKIRNDSVDSDGVWAMNMPVIDGTQTYFLRFIDSNGNESEISKSFIVSFALPAMTLKQHTPAPLASDVMLASTVPQTHESSKNKRNDEQNTEVILQPSVITEQPSALMSGIRKALGDTDPVIAQSLSAVGMIAGLVATNGLIALLPAFSTVPPLFSGGIGTIPMGVLLGLRKKKKHWGIVFDMQTKQALANVRVSLVNDLGRPLDTTITDKFGRYGFLTAPGTYTIAISKGGYTLFTKESHDALYGNIYQGNPFEITGRERAFIDLNIALDPGDFDWRQFAQRFTKSSLSLSHVLIRDAFYIIYAVGFIYTLAVAYFFPTGFNMFLAILYVVLFAWFIIQHFLVGKSYGTLKDKNSRMPIAFAQVGLYSLEGNQRIAFAVTDPLGRYYLLAEDGKYIVRVGGQFENRTFNDEATVRVSDGALRTDFVV